MGGAPLSAGDFAIIALVWVLVTALLPSLINLPWVLLQMADMDFLSRIWDGRFMYYLLTLVPGVLPLLLLPAVVRRLRALGCSVLWAALLVQACVFNPFVTSFMESELGWADPVFDSGAGSDFFFFITLASDSLLALLLIGLVMCRPREAA
jgi:hypothetical protein